MITVDNAKEKLLRLTGNGLVLTPHSVEVFNEVLDGREIGRKDTYFDPKANEWVGWLENRLAQGHLNYLPNHQVNGVWGGSTTEALSLVAESYGLSDYSSLGGVLTSEILRAVIDGTRGKQVKTRFDPNMNTYEWLEALVKVNGYRFETEPNCFNIVGVRGFLLPRGKVANTGDIYNDTILVAWVDPGGTPKSKAFVASVDPGRYYYSIRPMNSGGCAHLVPGQYSYKVGIHRTYTALVQNQAVSCARTNTANYTDKDPVTTGWYGINIHAGGMGNVYNMSAGCQIIQTYGRGAGSKWHEFINLILHDKDHVVNYTLFDGEDTL